MTAKTKKKPRTAPGLNAFDRMVRIAEAVRLRWPDGHGHQLGLTMNEWMLPGASGYRAPDPIPVGRWCARWGGHSCWGKTPEAAAERLERKVIDLISTGLTEEATKAKTRAGELMMLADKIRAVRREA